MRDKDRQEEYAELARKCDELQSKIKQLLEILKEVQEQAEVLKQWEKVGDQ